MIQVIASYKGPINPIYDDVMILVGKVHGARFVASGYDLGVRDLEFHVMDDTEWGYAEKNASLFVMSCNCITGVDASIETVDVI